MTNKIKVSKIFEAIKERPLVYLGKYDPHSLTCYIYGFRQGYWLKSGDNSNFYDLRNKVLAKRGWEIPSVYIDKEMQRKGFSNEEIINELLEIEIETWQLLEKKTD